MPRGDNLLASTVREQRLKDSTVMILERGRIVEKEEYGTRHVQYLIKVLWWWLTFLAGSLRVLIVYSSISKT